MSPIFASRFTAIFIFTMLVAQAVAHPSLAELYNRLQAKAMSSSVLRDQPIALAADEDATPRTLLPHLKKLCQNYKLPLHGLDVVTKPPVTQQDKGTSNVKSAAHIINRLSSVLLRI